VPEKKIPDQLHEKFLYPAKGPGMLWEKRWQILARDAGVEILCQSRLSKFHMKNGLSK